MNQWNNRDDAQERSFFGKPGVVSLFLVVGFVLYFFFG